MQKNVLSKSLQSCDVFLLAGGGGGVFWWGKWGRIGRKMYKNLVPPIPHVFPRNIQERLLFNLLCLNGDQHLSHY